MGIFINNNCYNYSHSMAQHGSKDRLQVYREGFENKPHISVCVSILSCKGIYHSLFLLLHCQI